MLNVKPKNMVEGTGFFVVDHSREEAKVDVVEAGHDVKGRQAIDPASLRVTRALPSDDRHITIPSNSSHLHQRLEQVLGAPVKSVELQQDIEDHLRKVRKSQLNPRAVE